MTVPATLSSVPNVAPYIQYVAAGGQTVYPYPFPITLDADLVVVINGVTQPTDSSYTLTGQGNPTGGNVTLNSGSTVGDIITLYRNIAIQRVTQIGQNSGFSSTAFNAEYNEIYLILQQLQASIALCLQIPNTNNPAPTTALVKASYANKYLAFDANGNPVPALLTTSGSLTGSIIMALILGANALTSAIIGNILFAQTTLEAALQVILGHDPVTNYAFPVGDVRRYGAFLDGSNVATTVTAIKNAVAANTVAPYNRVTFPAGTLGINAAIVCANAGQIFDFQGCTFNVYDNNAPGYGAISNGNSGPMGFVFQANSIKITGAARFVGQGTIGVTSLVGMIFDHCDFVQCPADLYFEQMSQGVMHCWCNYGVFGNVGGLNMNGTQPFLGGGTGGTLRNIVGCGYSKFGATEGKLNYKPVVYMSVQPDASSRKIDSVGCEVGWVSGTPATGSIEASLLAIRSANSCHFLGCESGAAQSLTPGSIDAGFAVGLAIIRYNTDAGWTVDNNTIDAVLGTYALTGSSLNAAIDCEGDNTTPNYPIGRNTVNTLKVTCGGNFGVYCSSGELTLVDAEITMLGASGTAGTRGILIAGGNTAYTGGVTTTATLNAKRLVVQGSYVEPVTYGLGGILNADYVEIRGGSVNGVSGAIIYNAGFGAAGGGFGAVNIDRIKYRYTQPTWSALINYVPGMLVTKAGVTYLCVAQNINQTPPNGTYWIATTAFAYAFLDLTNSYDTMRVQDVDGAGTSASARWVSDGFSVKNGRLISTTGTTPTSGTWAISDAVWNNAVAAAGAPGWCCTTGGAPGTWKAMANVAA